MKKMTSIFLISVFCLPFSSFAYDVMEVRDGGSVEGTVLFAGPAIPKDEVLSITSDTKFCGKSIPAEKYIISQDKRIKNVVVHIEGIKTGKAVPREPAVVDNLKCAFAPHVSIGYKGNKIISKNSDPVFHNVHTYVDERTMFNIGLPDQGSQVTKDLRKTGIVEVTCDSHPWMRAYVYVLDHPYAAVTNEKGEFVIKDIPPGTYSIEAWHEALGKVKVTDIKIETGKTTKVKIEHKK